MARVAVVVPLATRSKPRLAAWRFLKPRWQRLGYDVIEGACPGPWVKARAVQNGIDGTDADVFVIADADVWCDAIPEAVQRCDTWAVPHLMVRRLTKEATVDVYRTGRFVGALEEEPYRGRAGGGIVVVTRALWNEAPMDPRFVGWGQEDEAWGIALHHVAGPAERLGAKLWHLWHPPQQRMNRGIGSDESQALFNRYAWARERDAVIAEARDALRREPSQ